MKVNRTYQKLKKTYQKLKKNYETQENLLNCM